MKSKTILGWILLLLQLNAFSQKDFANNDFNSQLVNTLANKTALDYVTDNNLFYLPCYSYVMPSLPGTTKPDSACVSQLSWYQYKSETTSPDSSQYFTTLMNMLSDTAIMFIPWQKKYFDKQIKIKSNALQTVKKSDAKYESKKNKLLQNYIAQQITSEEHLVKAHALAQKRTNYIEINYPVFNQDYTLAFVYIKIDSDYFDCLYLWQADANGNWTIIEKSYCNYVAL